MRERHVTRSAGDTWCIFLDRDGVLNRRIDGDYVRTPDQFEWLPGALDAVVTLSAWAPYIVVVTNQQGVGKGLMTEADLDLVHETMCDSIRSLGGRVDAVLSCVHLESDRCPCRKPRAGLAQDWLDERPWVVPKQCLVVGDTWRDLAMARGLTPGRATTVWIDSEGAEPPKPAADWSYESLADFAAAVSSPKLIEEAM